MDDSALFDAFTMGLDGCNPRFAETHRSPQHPGSPLALRRPMSPKPRWSPGGNHRPTVHKCPIDPYPAAPAGEGAETHMKVPCSTR